MAETKKTIDDLAKSLKSVEERLKKAGKTEKEVLTDIEKKAKKATKATDDLSDSFKTFSKVLDGVSAQGLTNTLKDMPNYIKGVSKLQTSFSKFNQEASTTSEMMKTMGISFNKTMKELEGRSNAVAKSMNNLMGKANQFASVKDSLMDIPKQLKKMQDAMGSTPDIKLGSLDSVEKMLDDLKGKISDVDFDDISGKLEKIGKSGASDALVQGLKDKLSKLKITSPIIGGEEIAKKAVASMSGELDKLAGMNPGDVLISNFLRDLDELAKDDTFAETMKSYQSDIDAFKDKIKEPGVSYEELSSHMINLNDKMKESMTSFFEDFDKEASKLSTAQREITKQQQELSDKFREGYTLTFNTDEAVATFQGVLAQMSADAYSLQANNIIPDDQLMNASEMKQALRELIELQEENREIQQAISSGEAEEKGYLELVLKAQKDNEKQLRKQVKYMKELEKTSGLYSKNMMAAAETGFGQEKADEFAGKIFGISGKLGKLGSDLGENSIIGKGLGKLSSLTGKFGGALSKLSFPIGLISGAIAMTKAVLKIEGQFASLSQEINNTGALMNTTAANVGSAMLDLNKKATNLPGLMKAAAGGKEFALARGEILDVVNTLNEAGLPARNLKDQLAGVATTAEGAKNEFLGAANVVTTFSHNLGVSKGAIAGMMGEMSNEFGSTMGTMKDTFSDITASAAASNMSTNRFLATVQTATAGMALYESQVADVAKMIGQLGKNTNLTGADMAKVAKTVSEFAGDTKNATAAFAIIARQDPKQFQNIVNESAKAVSDIDKKIMAERAKGDKADVKTISRLEEQKKRAQALNKALEKGNYAEAGAELEFAGPEVQKRLVGGTLKAFDKISKGNTLAFKDMTKQVGMGELGKLYKARGGDFADEMQKGAEVEGNFEEQQKKALAADKDLGNARNKLLEGIQTRLTIGLGAISGILLTISAALAAGGGVKGAIDIFKMFKGGGKGGTGGIGGGFFSKAKDIGKKGLDLFKGKGSSIAGAAEELGEGALKSKGIMGLFSKGNGILKNVGKKAGPIGSAISAAMGIYDTYNAVTDPTKDKGDVGKAAGGAAGSAAGAWAGATGGAALGTMIFPGVGTVIGGAIGAFLGGMGGEKAGGALGEYIGESFEDTVGKTPAEAAKIQPAYLNEKGVPSPPEMNAANMTKLGKQYGLDPKTIQEMYNNGVSPLSGAGASSSITNNNTITNHNSFNINGGDPEELKRIILDVITKHAKQSS